jgi:ligand-binding SRPBCC domain-containing protein
MTQLSGAVERLPSVRPSAASHGCDESEIMANFEASIPINTTAEAAFEFLMRPANLVIITPSAAPMEIIQAPERFSVGVKYEFTLGGFGPVQRMTHEITEVVSPTRYVEKAIKSPLPHWIHQHIIEPKGNGEVVVTDRIEFEPPGGFIGFLITEDKILESLDKGFTHRHRELKRLLEQDGG